ncbi:TlpA family protein disulfide reductase [Pedobacter sp. GR22-6]|uniref:TlpA family protein disulfide reductase n=1 Tax=Pedobacter sp. GR22-6 TaxID=3127957 RepID=UPI00307E3F1A
MRKKLYYALIAQVSLSMVNLKLAAQTLAADTSLSGIYNFVKSATDAKRMEMMTELFMSKVADKKDRQTDQCCKSVAIAYACEGNLEKSMYWLDRCNERSTINLAIATVMKELLTAKRTDLAEQFLAAKVVTSNLEKNKLDVLRGELLFEQGKFAASLPLLKPAFESTGEGAERYATALLSSGFSDQVFNEFSQIVANQLYLSDNLKEFAKEKFRKKFGTASRLSAIFDSTSVVQRSIMDEHAAKMAISQASPNFELKDLNGRIVSLKALRGKTIFIDFWATWCGPCVYSFPGMQKAVDYYKNDSSVVFLFVHSYERVPNATEEVRRYVKDKKYRFDVYMDLNSIVAKQFNVKSLPTKLVIDKDGVIKVRSVGLIKEDRAIPEIRAMIELARKGS